MIYIFGTFYLIVYLILNPTYKAEILTMWKIFVFREHTESILK